DGTTANATGSYNSFLGYNTKALADGDTNETVIGYNATGIGSNSVVLGNDSVLTTALKGNVGIGTTSPATTLSVAGSEYLTGSIGIGTASPTQALDINHGNINMSQEPAPGAPTVAVNTTTGNLTGNYRYRITFVTADGETSMGAYSATVSPNAEEVDLTNIPTGSSKVTARKIYRTVANGGYPYNAQYVATISDNTTTTYTDNLADSSLGAYAPGNNTTGSALYTNGTKTGEADNGVTIFGYNAGRVNAGFGNSFVGTSAGLNNTTGNFDSFVGTEAGKTNTTGSNNSFVGRSAGYYNTTGNQNSFVGVLASFLNTTGSSNIAQGYQAGAYIADGTTANATGSNNSFLGNNTKALADGDTNETVIGYNATGIGSNSVVLGNDSVLTTALKGNVGIGTTSPATTLSVAGSEYLTGSIGIGISSPTQALDINHGNINMSQEPAPSAPTVAVNATSGNLTGDYRYRITFVTADGETSMGASSAVVSPSAEEVDLTNIPTGSSKVTARKIYRTVANASYPYLAQYVATISDNTTTTYTDNLADSSLGAYAPGNNTTGSALYTNGTKSGEADRGVTIFGYGAGSVNAGAYNSFVGNGAGQNNTTGFANSFVGNGAGVNNTTGYFNSFVGMQAGQANTTGYDNSFLGTYAGFYNTTGKSNSFVGMYAGYRNTTGSNNSFVGQDAGAYIADGVTANATGSYNSFLGNNTKALADGDTNETVIGYNATGIGSNSVVLGNDSVLTTALKGNVGIGTTSPLGPLQIEVPTFTSHDDSSQQVIISNSGSNAYGIRMGFTSVGGYGVINVLNPAVTWGNLILQDGGGNVGIGTTTPVSTLTVQGSGCFSVGPGATVTCGTAAGNIYYTTANTGNYDVAERYKTYDTSLQKGDVITFDTKHPFAVEKATSPKVSFIGVVSSNPGVLLGGADSSMATSTSVPVALSGRVPVKVSIANGNISVGDRLTISSSTPGVAVKLVGSGSYLGEALERYSGNGNASGTILAFIDPGMYYKPAKTDNGIIAKIRKEITSLLKNGVDQITATVAHFKDVVVNNLTANRVVTNGIEMKNSKGDIYCVIVGDNGALVSTSGKCPTGDATVNTQSGNDTSGNGGTGNADNTKPSITLNGDNPTNVTVGSTYTDKGVVAKDSNGETSTITLKLLLNGTTTQAINIDTSTTTTYTITYVATDNNNGLTATSTRIVNVVASSTPLNDTSGDGDSQMASSTPKDTEAPIISLKGNNPQKITAGDEYVESGATVTDNVDKNVRLEIDASGVSSTTYAGTYYVKYNATDKAGNKAKEIIRDVIISPKISIPSNNNASTSENGSQQQGTTTTATTTASGS
ncbi:MAG TPA: DUF5011 domain-containing protein, partial [Candidatus Kaiserbacteria bacterium]|nr:DUF5011 domain-containing protein [Candidatus Kaiserbacteria bacterium]